MEKGFKVGDFVVFDITKPYCAKLPGDLMEWLMDSPNCQHDAIVWIGKKMFEVGGKTIRHATPEEIAAGHRIDHFVKSADMVELSGNSEELEVLNLIDVSPNAKVVEL